MPLDPWLSGRMERRLPIIVVVRLANCVPASVDGEEKTYTDNVSPRGARIFSKRACWNVRPTSTLNSTFRKARRSAARSGYATRKQLRCLIDGCGRVL